MNVRTGHERVLHFFDPASSKMRPKLAPMARRVDVLLGNLEDGIPPALKDAAREGLIEVARTVDLGDAQLWTRINSLDSPWVLDDLCTLIPAIGDRLDVIMVPKVGGPEDIHYVDRMLCQLEAKAGIARPVRIHALIETASGMASLPDICAASPRMHGATLGMADLAADRRMKTTRVGGGHPEYKIRTDPIDGEIHGDRPAHQQDLWHYSVARLVDATVAAGLLPLCGPFADFGDTAGCEDHFRNAWLHGCVGGWSLHPSQVDIVANVFVRPQPE